jgi:hypothetical protein
MSPEADRIHCRLLRYTWIDHMGDRCATAIAAAAIIRAQQREIERLQAALAAQD